MLCRRLLFAFCSLLPACILSAQTQTPVALPIADKITAVVGDQIILSSDIKNTVEDMKRQGIKLPANATCLITEQAIIAKILVLQASRDSLAVSDEEVEAELRRRLSVFDDSEIDINDASFVKLKEEARMAIRERIVIELMRQKITRGITITPSEVQSYFNHIPKDSLPFIETEMEVGQIVFYPDGSKDLEQYVINELAEYKKKVESKTIEFCPFGGKGEACTAQKINRNNIQLEPAFTAAIFRLKEGEISQPIKSRFGFFLVQLIERKGDDASVRYIFRPHPVTDIEINEAKAQLNALRAKITEGRLSFTEAAVNFSEDEAIKFAGPYFQNSEGSTRVTIDELKRDVAELVSKMNVGEISRPMFFVDEQNRKGVRLIYLKSRLAAHAMNLKDDYTKVSQAALEEKKARVLDKWIASKIPVYYIMIDDSASADCPQIQRFESSRR